MNSSYYKGTLFRDKLSAELQHANNVERFMTELKKLYVVYQEIW